VLVVVEGCVAGEVTPENTLTTLLTVNLAVSGKDNTIITVLNETNTAEEPCQLLAAVNEGTTGLSSEETTQLIGGFKQNGKAVEVLVMPL